MVVGKRALGICDVCGWTYKLKQLRRNSYGSLVCPADYDGGYDLSNHPQNRTANLREHPYLKNSRPEHYNERNSHWEDLETFWESITTNWNQI